MAKKNSRSERFRQQQQQQSKNDRPMSSRQQRRQAEREAKKQPRKPSTAQKKTSKLQDVLRRARQTLAARLHLNAKPIEDRRIFMANTRRAWQGSASPSARISNIIDAYQQRIEREYNGDLSEFIDDEIERRKMEIDAAYKQDVEYLDGLGWTDEALEALANSHSKIEIYELLKDLGYYG